MTERLSAKEILKDKFWIVESEGEKVATLSIGDDSQLLDSSNTTGTRFYKNIKALTKNLNADITWSPIEPVESKPKAFEIYGFSTSCAPYNPMFDVKQRLALFTKSKKSKSLYCAGYFIIRFDKGWVKSFCPKLITVERYETEGPFKTDLEMRQQLSRANAR